MISLLKYDHCVSRNSFQVHLTIVEIVDSHGRRKQDVNVVCIYIFCIHKLTHASPIYYFHAILCVTVVKDFRMWIKLTAADSDSHKETSTAH